MGWFFFFEHSYGTFCSRIKEVNSFLGKKLNRQEFFFSHSLARLACCLFQVEIRREVKDVST